MGSQSISNTVQSNLRELELNALLEVTEAINNNLTEESLYKIYHFTLLANLKVKKLALFVDEDSTWDCKVHFGVAEKDCHQIDLALFENLKGVFELGDNEHCAAFDFAIPVLHNGILLALVFVGDVVDHSDQFTRKSATTFLEALTNIILVAIQNKRLARQQLAQEAMKKELEIAQQVQEYLFPKYLPDTDDLKISAFYQPHHNVGGDYYDYIEIAPNQWLVCIADVSGKGVPAAIMMSNFQASLRTLVRQTDDLETIISELNYQIKLSGNGDIFITFFVAIYDLKKKQLRYMNCGHNAPLIKVKNGKFQELNVGTTVLGMFHPLPFMEIGMMENLSEFFLFCYTDGLNEAINPDEGEFGEERIEEILSQSFDLSPSVLNSQMMNEVDEFRQGQDYRDDVTILTIAFTS